MSNAEAWFNIALRPRKPEGSLQRTAQDGHLDSHTAPEPTLGAYRWLVGWLKCCFTSTETVGLLGTGAQDVHLDFYTAPELWVHTARSLLTS